MTDNSPRPLKPTELARRFRQLFPIGAILDIKEFDDWLVATNVVLRAKDTDKDSAEWQGFISQRNAQRKRLNVGALRLVPSFQVDVQNHGVSYIVLGIGQAHEKKQESIAQRVGSIFQERSFQFKSIQNSEEFKTLREKNELLELYANQIERRLESWDRRIDLEMRELNLDFSQLKDQLTLLSHRDPEVLTDQSIKHFLDNGTLLKWNCEICNACNPHERPACGKCGAAKPFDLPTD